MAMTSFGYTLSTEEHDPPRLVALPHRAEELGFHFVSVSDHYHPWVRAQGQYCWGDERTRRSGPPAQPPPVIVSGFGDDAVRLAARIGDGYWGNAPERDRIELYENSGGSGPRYAQLNLCWAEDVATARKT